MQSYLDDIVSRGEIASAELVTAENALSLVRNKLHGMATVQAKQLILSMGNSIRDNNHTALRTFIANFLQFHLSEIIKLRLQAKLLDENELSRKYEAIDVLIQGLRIPEPEYGNKSREQIGIFLGEAGQVIQEFLLAYCFDHEFKEEIRAMLYNFLEYSKDDVPYDLEF